ncbi:MAG TPA: substrate-binding domain-containing protein [Opitutales bacterium]|nr:substrate-binding domain-containing protein [Opitutales bacterium]
MATNTIAVIAPFHGVGEKVLVGVADYFQKQTRLKMRPIHLDANVSFENMDLSRMGGAIIVDMLEEMPQALRDLNIPKVEVFERNHKEGVPLVSVDNDQIGALAAQHLYGRGFKHFAFVGGIDHPFSKNRYMAFKKFLDGKNVNLHLFSETFPPRSLGSTQDPRWKGFFDRLMTWLDALPKPVGVFASDDWKAFDTQLACRSLGIEIPGQVAVIGVNDDNLACQIAETPQSSIRLPYERVGFEAAAMLDAILSDKPTDKRRILKPIGLVTRESTNTFAVTDEIVEKALRFMQKESNKPIRVEEVLKHVGVSRSLLERRFRGAIGRTPLVEMRRQRVERARALLADTDLAINQIASMCGFASNIRFTTVFREQVGVTPTDFRAQMHSMS